MRRIYESGALRRDDSDPFRPNETDERRAPRATRTVPVAALSRALTPQWLRRRAISLDVSSPQSVYPAGTSIPFTVTMRNALPVPVAIPTRSPLPWSWRVDGVREASHVAEELPAERHELRFDRGERKVFRRAWSQSFRVSETEWEPAPPGEYTIGAAILGARPIGDAIRDRTTVRIE